MLLSSMTTVERNFITLGGVEKSIHPKTGAERNATLHDVWDSNMYDIANRANLFDPSKFPASTTTSLDFTRGILSSRESALRHIELIALETASEVTCQVVYWKFDSRRKRYMQFRSGDYFDARYIAEAKPYVVTQIERAGLRLASLLNAIYDYRIWKAAAAEAKRLALIHAHVG